MKHEDELTVKCAACGKPFTIRYFDTGKLNDGPGMTRCPHCKKMNTQSEVLGTKNVVRKYWGSW